MHLLVPPFGSFDYNALLPLGIVAVTPLLVLIVDLIMPPVDARRGIAVGISVAGLLGAAYVLIRQYLSHQFGPAFGFGFILGGFSIAFSLIIIAAAIFSLLMVPTERDDEKEGPDCALMMWSTLGAMLMSGAADLMTIFLGLEILSLGALLLVRHDQGRERHPQARSARGCVQILDPLIDGEWIHALRHGAACSERAVP